MVVSTAHMATEHAAAYLMQLCEHFADPGHRHSAQEFVVSFDDRQGLIDFAPVVRGTCRVDAQDRVLIAEARGSDEAALERVERIVARHLERFGQPEGLTVEWRRRA
jgi:uncharacterized protein